MNSRGKKKKKKKKKRKRSRKREGRERMEAEEWVSGRAERWRRREKLLLLQRWAFLFPVPARSKVYRGFNFTFPQPIRAHPRLLERTLTRSENRTGSSLWIFFLLTLFYIFPALPSPFISLHVYSPLITEDKILEGGLVRGGGLKQRRLFF